ncbi:MAG TPA: hypothetical protein VFV34_25420, partial [Blastocatellia bacterium]|nr:hypothetical protein [Blastocatellia bacterium]
VYFITRMRKGDSEVDEGWGPSKGLLIDEQPATERRDTSAAAAAPQKIATASAPAPPVHAGDRAKAEVPVSYHDEAGVAQPAELAPRTGAEVVKETAETEAESAVLDEHVWAELESAKETPPGAKEPTLETSERAADVAPPRATRASFEPPRIEPIAPRRDPYEPPAILPIVPRQTAPAQRERGPVPQPVRTEFQQASRVAAAGAVAGRTADLPREPSRLGTPGRLPGALGIASLSNYSQPPEDESKSYAGTIALVVAVLLVGGTVLAYFLIPRFHGWVDRMKMKARGETPVAQPAQTQPKVKIFPQRPQVEKNQVKAFGYVFNNTADEVLSGLTVELSLIKSDGSTDTVSAPVKPDEVQPGQPGYSGRPTYEVIYDGKKYTGYRVLRVLSNGVELPFATVNPGAPLI